MTSQERQDALRIARVMRAGRKLFGKDQTYVADVLQISQAAISKIETGRSIVSTSQWYRFCSHFSLNAETCFSLGSIDNCSEAQTKPTYVEHRFRVPKKYLRYQGSKVRTMLPLLHFFERKLGSDRLNEYFESVQIDPDFFAVYDNQLNVSFSLEMASYLISKGHLNRDNLAEFAECYDSALVHGQMHGFYREQRERRELLRSLVENIGKYERNCSYEILDENDEKMLISIRPKAVMKKFEYTNDVLGSFVCDVKKEYIKRFSNYTDDQPCEINELECHFKGSDRCLYEITLG